MATRPLKPTKREGIWIPSEDVWINEKRGVSKRRDPKTGRLLPREQANGTPAGPERDRTR
jgi:hypothetical protein